MKDEEHPLLNISNRISFQEHSKTVNRNHGNSSSLTNFESAAVVVDSYKGKIIIFLFLVNVKIVQI